MLPMPTKVTASIVFHSNSGHTRQAAQLLESAISSKEVHVNLVPVENVHAHWEVLHGSDTLIFGCPTLLGNVSARFKDFMEETGAFWYRQLWRNKWAAAFTVSSTVCGDKSNVLQSMALFAAQHGMHWINLGIVPRFINDQQTDGQNRLASYQGLMIQSDNSQKQVDPFHPGDILTLEMFGHRIAEVTLASAKSSTFPDAPLRPLVKNPWKF